jgi:hypothetical protein
MFQPASHYFRVRLTRDGEGVNVFVFAADADDAVAQAKETIAPAKEQGATDASHFDDLRWLVASVEKVR